MVELKSKFEEIVTEENARRKAEYEASNPIYMAKKLIDEGDFEGAIEKYKDAIESAETDEDKGELVLSIASLQFRKLGQTNNARESARRAASLKPNWGAPYLLIGDMYVAGARNCGDDWGSRLAVIAAIDKYQYAKSIDPSMASDANERIGRISSALPEKEDGFMRQIKEGQTLTVPCWIGESVKVRFKT
jgi:tetratricopeptide (TPR) repeat protein